ncbi:HBS1-like protein isoform X2 [Varroa destructor]|uniref:Tr-type G domain-containing protein n=1 Tax=Varroa destructor TaxID=109461 RepID=A0A7M7JWK7_VARDE|nr:HBS1-like protein isoform X2 [Varroa destructor]
MARHRNIRTMNYDEEIDDYSSDDYGTSFENGCVTPETESLYTYSRERLQSVSKIWEPHNPPVKEEDEDEMATHPHDDDVIDTSQVTEADREKFFDCLDKMRSVVGDSEPENVLCQAAKSQNFDPERALDIIFSRRSGRDKPDVPAAIHGAFKAGVAEAVSNPNSQNNQFQSEFNIDALLGSASVTTQGMDIDSLLSGKLPSIAFPALPDTVTDFSHNSGPLHGSPGNLADSLGTLMDSSLTLDDLLGTSIEPRKGLDLKQILAGNTSNQTKEQAGLNQTLATRESNNPMIVPIRTSTTDINELSLSGKVTDALDELLQASAEQQSIERNRLAPSQETSEMSRVLLKLQRRNEGALGTTIRWYKGLYLRQKETFAFEEPSPDDLVKNTVQRNGETFCGVKKLFFPETKPLKQHRAPLISVPPVEVPMRVTFSGKNFKELSSKASKFQPGKEAARELNELKIEQEINNAPKKLPPDTPKVTSSPKPARHLKVDTKIIQEQYDKERSARKPLLNLVVIGHVDAGKSTLMGHLLYLTGNVSKKTMDKYEHESKKFGKASFAFAWVLDETPEERSRGITMDIAHARLETGHRIVNILDAPGHKEFIPNMITGAAQADAGILVVNATRGEFETGFESGGQTREHTMLIRSLGVSQLAVVVNKLETCAWSENRFNEIASALRPFFKQTGFGEQSVSYVPCSGLTGDNLHERSKNSLLTAWYKGPCLLEVIDHMRPPARAVTRPLRMCVTDVFKGVQSGVCVAGRIESGSVAQGDKLSVMPAQENCIVKALAIDELSQQRVFAGDNVVVTLDKCDPANIVSGSVLCDLSNLIRVVTKFEAKVVIFNVDVPIIKGFPVILHFQATSEQAHFGRLIKELNRGTGEVIREKPRYLGKNSTGVVIIKVARPVCLELYQDSKELGRITLRQRGQTIAAGIVTALL